MELMDLAWNVLKELQHCTYSAYTEGTRRRLSYLYVPLVEPGESGCEFESP